MWTLMRASMTAAFLAALVFAVGCEDTPITVGKDSTMTLVASPSTVLIDPAQGIDSAQSSIVATILNASGVPQKGITVFFSNSGGVLASSGAGVVTNSGGNALDVLTVRSVDGAEISVSATSAVLTKSVKVAKSTVATNRPPVPLIVPTPRDEQVTGRSVVFDGSNSSDPDTGDFVTMYKWVITSTNHDADKPTNPIIVEGPGVSGVSFPSDLYTSFVNIQELTVTLMVTDDKDAPAQFNSVPPIPVAYRSQATLPYRIVAVRCANNTKPTAVIAGAATQQIFGAPGASLNFLLDGTLSFDAETPIESYTWNCGNGSIPIPQVPPSKAVCKYTVDQTSRTFTATLVVTDRGTGVIDPSTGQYQCAAASVAASVQVVVSPLAGGGP